MALNIVNVVFDCTDAAALAAFWSSVLNRPVDEGGNPFFSTIGRQNPDEKAGPALMFIQVPESKQTKNRLHLDLHADDDTGAAQVERVLGLGATKLSEHHEFGVHWVTFQDPEGNEFDLAVGADAG